MHKANKKLSFAEVQRIANGNLVFLKELCDKNSISFFLAWGTALGAVRHQGFIPWDDDIDIYMTRGNFNRFVEAMRQNDNKRYELLYVGTDKDYSLPLPKLIDTQTRVSEVAKAETRSIGVWVDIFILDNVPDNPCIRSAFFKQLDFLQFWWHYLQYRRDYQAAEHVNVFKYWFFKCFSTIFSARFFAKQLDKVSQKYNRKERKSFCNCMWSTNRSLDTYEKTIFGEGTTCHFENNEYLIPEKYHQYLAQSYGNYMELPPENERMPKHKTIAFFK